MLQRRIETGDIAGAVTLVARNGRIVHFETHGLMDLETKNRWRRRHLPHGFDDETDYGHGHHDACRRRQVASHRSGIEIHSGIQRHESRCSENGAAQGAPQFYTVPADREITIRDLLTHTSGLVSGPISTAEAAKFAESPQKLWPTIFHGSDRCRWNSSRVALELQSERWIRHARRIVEILSGQTFDVFLKQRIFDPLV